MWRMFAASSEKNAWCRWRRTSLHEKRDWKCFKINSDQINSVKLLNQWKQYGCDIIYGVTGLSACVQQKCTTTTIITHNNNTNNNNIIIQIMRQFWKKIYIYIISLKSWKRFFHFHFCKSSFFSSLLKQCKLCHSRRFYIYLHCSCLYMRRVPAVCFSTINYIGINNNWLCQGILLGKRD